MLPRRKSRPAKPRRRRSTAEQYYARARRRHARRTAQENERLRYWCGANFFWDECGRACRRANACRAADPRVCFEWYWRKLDANDRTFRREFMQALVRLRDPDEAMVEAIALALMRRETEAGAAANPLNASA
jgi:hypothetical protein